MPTSKPVKPTLRFAQSKSSSTHLFHLLLPQLSSPLSHPRITRQPHPPSSRRQSRSARQSHISMSTIIAPSSSYGPCPLLGSSSSRRRKRPSPTRVSRTSRPRPAPKPLLQFVLRTNPTAPTVLRRHRRHAASCSASCCGAVGPRLLMAVPPIAAAGAAGS